MCLLQPWEVKDGFSEKVTSNKRSDKPTKVKSQYSLIRPAEEGRVQVRECKGPEGGHWGPDSI